MSFELIPPFLAPDRGSFAGRQHKRNSMGNPDSSWWYERDGIMRQDESISFDGGKLRTGPRSGRQSALAKKLDEGQSRSQPQLPDGSRLAAVIPPVSRPRSGFGDPQVFKPQVYGRRPHLSRHPHRASRGVSSSEQIRNGKTLLISGGTGTREDDTAQYPWPGNPRA